MVTAPLFSVLLPTHSRIDVIEYAVQSVLNQTVMDFELLVVGDGCASGTYELLQRFQDQRIRFFDLPKAPYFGYANRNIALKESRGQFIAFMADDDLIFPDHLEILLNGFKKGSALAYTQAIWVSTDGIAAPFLTNLENNDELELFMLHHNSIPASCIAYRADVLPTRDAWPEDIAAAADWHLWHKIIEACPQNPLTYCRTPTVLHFSAKWKQSRNSGMSAFANYLEIADNVDWWPRSLQPKIPPSMNEQCVFAAKMLENPAIWSFQVRQDISDVVNRIAWDNMNNGQSLYIKPIIDQKELLSAAHREIEKLKTDLEDIRKSTCWILTKPLRKMVEFIRKYF